jgi:hypothetical protein
LPQMIDILTDLWEAEGLDNWCMQSMDGGMHCVWWCCLMVLFYKLKKGGRSGIIPVVGE